MVASRGFARNMVPVVLVTKLQFVGHLLDQMVRRLSSPQSCFGWFNEWNSSSKDIRVKEDHLREVLRPENRSKQADRRGYLCCECRGFLTTDHRGCFLSICLEHHHTEEDQTWFHTLWASVFFIFQMCWIHQSETGWPLLLRARFGWSSNICRHETFASKPPPVPLSIDQFLAQLLRRGAQHLISVIWAFCFWRKCVISMMKGSSKHVHQRTLVNTQTHISRLRSFQLQQTCKTIVGHKLIFGENPLLKYLMFFFAESSWLNCRPRWFELRMDALELFLGVILKQRPWRFKEKTPKQGTKSLTFWVISYRVQHCKIFLLEANVYLESPQSKE